MKKIIVLAFCIVAMASCTSLNQAAQSNTAANATGASCGKSLVTLYNNYKATGNIDLAANLSDVLTVTTAYSQLRENKDNASYKNAFTSGMITSGAPFITKMNSTNILSAILNSTGLSGVNASNVQQKAETASAIISILNAMK